MESSFRARLRLFSGLLAVLGSWVLFLFSCFATATDGQGAIIFLFTLPVMLVLLFGARRLMKDTETPRRLASASLFFLAAFFLSAPLPGLQLFPAAIVGGVAKTFEAFSGKTPYAWARAKHDAAGMVAKELERSGGEELDLRKIPTGYAWDRLCLLPPYTTAQRAKAFLRISPDWPLSLYSKVEQDEGFVALVFLSEKERYPLYVVDLSRARADLADLKELCLPRAEAVFHRERNDRNPSSRKFGPGPLR